jgi:hypothetical protein
MHRILLPVLLLAAGCTENTFTQLTTVDYFQQNRRNQLDMLVVIDNSCSMAEEQGNLAANFDQLIDTFATAEVDWRIGVTTTDVEAERFRGLLISGDDEIILRDPEGRIVDEVRYDRTWPFEDGVALQLDRDFTRPTSNLNLDNWCPAPDTFGDQGERGSPGAWNPGCDGAAIAPPTPQEPDAGPRTPRLGDVVITEIMAASAGRDSQCEWFEVVNRSDDTLDLSGVAVEDQGNNRALIGEGTLLAPQAVLVVGRSADSEVNCGVPVDVAFPEGFALQDHIPVLTPDTEDADERFAEMIAQGTQGTGIEHGLEAARLVFEEPYYTDQNREWLREDAALAILVVSDEDDISPRSVDEYERAYRELKGDRAFRQDGWFTLNAIVGTEPTDSVNDVSCISDDGVAYYAARYIDLAARTGGLVESICEEDYSTIVQNLGLSVSGLEVRFGLSEVPVLESLEVSLYEDRSEDSWIRDLVLGEDFEYVEEDNALLFDQDQVPPPQTFVVAEYRPVAGAGRNQDTDTTDEESE